MLRSLALFNILGLPAVAYGGLLTLILLLVTATIGYLTIHGKIKTPVSVHVWLARTVIVLAIFHAVFSLSIFLK